MLEQILINHTFFVLLLKKLIFKCADDITYRKSKQKIDTLLLKEAIEICEKEFEPKFFWIMYETIFKSFVQSFDCVNFENLPFAKDEKSLESFLMMLWENYFVCEIETVMKENPRFAINVMKAVVHKEDGFKWGLLLNNIFKKRYEF